LTFHGKSSSWQENRKFFLRNVFERKLSEIFVSEQFLEPKFLDFFSKTMKNFAELAEY